MPTPMISDNWSRFVLPIVRKNWSERMIAIQSPLKPFFGIEKSISSVEYAQGLGSLGLVNEYNSGTAQGMPASIEYDSFKPLYEKTFTHKEYAKGIAIERKLWDDARYGEIRRKAQSLGQSFGTTIAYHMSSVLNNAFTSGYTGGDSKVLCADDHPTNSSDDSTYDNAGSTALSYDAVVSTLQTGKGLTDDRSNPLPVIYNVLYVPVELEATAYEIVNAMAKPGTADNDANFVGGQGLTVVVDPYLTDANNWFMLSSQMSQMHMLWYWRVMPELSQDPNSGYDLVSRYRGYMRFSYGWDDARFIYGHEVT